MLAVLFAVTFYFGWTPLSSDLRGDLDSAIAPELRCFQGVCEELESDSTFYSKWWTVSLTYLRHTSVGMALAVLAAAVASAFVTPKSARPHRSVDHGQTANGEPALPDIRGVGRQSIGLNVPALVMAVFVFAPLVWAGRSIMSAVAVLVVGRLVAESRPNGGGDYDGSDERLAEAEEAPGWRSAVGEALRDLLRTILRYSVVIVPTVVVAGILAGPAVQLASADEIARYVGDTATGVAIAATLGILITVPLMAEVPLVALLLALGVGAAPAATLLFASAFGGPLAFRRLVSLISTRSAAIVTASTWAVAALGGVAVVAAIAATKLGEDLDAESVDGAQSTNVASVALDGPVFVNATGEAGIDFVHHPGEWQEDRVSAGVVVFDFNGDGLSDIYFPQLDGPNALYRNDGGGTFSEVAAAAGVDDPEGSGNGGCAADYDNDGDQDLYVTNHGPSRFFRNDGDGTFSDATVDVGFDHSLATLRSTGCSWGDYDRDGFLDFVVVRYAHRLGFKEMQVDEYSALVPSKSDVPFNLAVGRLSLYHNSRDGSFSDATAFLGDTRYPGSADREGEVGNLWGAGFQPTWVDFDNDRDPDLYVVNDMGGMLQPNVLWRNDGAAADGAWRFEDVSASSGADAAIDGMALAVGDYDLDGFLDFYMTNIGPSVLLRNNGDGLTFSDSTVAAGAGIGFVGAQKRMTWGAMFFDYDNDGDEDLYVVSGLQTQKNVLLRNERDGAFVDISSGSGADDSSWGHGGAYLDYDGDGCLDLVVSNWAQPASLFRNLCDSGGNWLVVEAAGADSNRDGIGARITVESKGDLQVREIFSGASQMGQNMREAHFGLGTATRVDTLTVQWPSGQVQTMSDVPANRRVIVKEPG